MRWATALEGVRVETVDTACGPLEFARVGSGPGVMLVHGTPGSWRQAIPLAEDLVPGVDVLLPSRPGYGATPIRTGRTYEQQADAFAALLDELQIDRCAIVGISGGGPSSAAFATRHPSRTSALVLACATAPHMIRTPRAMDLLRVPGLAEVIGPAVRALGRWRFARPGAADADMRRHLTRDELVRAEADPQIRSDLVRHVLGHQQAPSGLAGLRNDYAQFRRSRAHPSDISVSCPVLVLHGDADTVVALEQANHWAEALSGTLTVYEQAGHLFLLTRRRESADAIRGFLGSRT